ncbi:hypothetical protein [Flavobacterium selenitireducens]|uniref:hypothetical protein n=1 Tax=Flavobacterium selenitireducens TaxID=2722704 RepID=UPI00168BBFAA|nr:hypothetical protein [Flavobacterium selenitireducens]MBD3582660.1 hypothetical protein [Flavobacterium selenitireducens]
MISVLSFRYVMEDWTFIDFIWQLLADCQTGFFYYTLFYFGLRISKGKSTLAGFDSCATAMICGVSALYFVTWIAGWTYLLSVSEDARKSTLERLGGPYSFGLWLPSVFYFVLPQLLWIRKISENYISRFLVAFFLFFNFEKFVILVTSLHRDYLPGLWTMYSGSLFPEIIYGIVWKFVLFTGLTALLFSFRRKRNNFAG